MQSSHGPLVSVDGVVLCREGRIPWAALAKKVQYGSPESACGRLY